MKTLLLTDIPPCSNLTAGIVTAQMCRFVPVGQLAIFCVQNRHIFPQPYADLAEIPIRFVTKPNELYRRLSIRGFPLGSISACGSEIFQRYVRVPSLVRQAVSYGLEQQVTSLWIILQGQTMVRMAADVAHGLKVPFRVQVWDPLEWWLKAHGVDRLNRKWDLAAFDKAIELAAHCAAASWEMADHYKSRYGTPSEAIIASVDRNVARQPEPRLRDDDEIAIGMAGQFYAEDEWLSLVRALEFANWRIKGRRVTIRVYGHQYPQSISPEHLDFRGWLPQPSAIASLSETCDIAYCPYPYAPAMVDVAKLSFPSKIPTYLAAGRPILFHGPQYASPAHYLKKTGAGIISRSSDPSAVYDALVSLVENQELYQNVALAAQQAFLEHFTTEDMRLKVLRFLGY